MPNVLRHYSVGSFLSILVFAGLMAILYRTVTMDSVAALAEQNNLVIAQGALQPIRAELADYLVATSEASKNSSRPLPVPKAIDEAIREVMGNSRVTRLIVYDRNGVVSASTDPSRIGAVEADNPGFMVAMQGKIWASLAYRDMFNRFSRAIADENLVESYIPVRRGPFDPVVGVLEVYTDVRATIREAEQAQFSLFAVTVLLLVILYAALMMTLRRARQLIEEQQQQISEKTAVLELLSASSLRREERERKKLAGTLHEGLAQTLSAIKLAVETIERSAFEIEPGVAKEVVPGLQKAIREVRAIATDLRPPSLDDLGLIATIHAVCREFASAHPATHVIPNITAPEETIPARLRIFVYRNIEAGLKIVGERQANEVEVSLRIEDASLVLLIEGSGIEDVSPRGLSNLAADSYSPLSAIRERTIISGGELSIRDDEAGRVTLRAVWSL